MRHQFQDFKKKVPHNILILIINMLRIIKLVIPNASSSLGIYFIWDVSEKISKYIEPRRLSDVLYLSGH